jgi:hypothetical protein
LRLLVFAEEIPENQENFLELSEPFGFPVQHDPVAKRSEKKTNIKEAFCMNSHQQWIFRMGLSEEIPRCIIERAIRPTRKSKIHADASVQITSDV